jgi:hypothetical protein
MFYKHINNNIFSYLMVDDWREIAKIDSEYNQQIENYMTDELVRFANFSRLITPFYDITEDIIDKIYAMGRNLYSDDWRYIFENYDLSEEFIDKYSDKVQYVGWSTLTKTHNFTYDFLKKHKKNIEWKWIKTENKINNNLFYNFVMPQVPLPVELPVPEQVDVQMPLPDMPVELPVPEQVDIQMPLPDMPVELPVQMPVLDMAVKLPVQIPLPDMPVELPVQMPVPEQVDEKINGFRFPEEEDELNRYLFSSKLNIMQIVNYPKLDELKVPESIDYNEIANKPLYPDEFFKRIDSEESQQNKFLRQMQGFSKLNTHLMEIIKNIVGYETIDPTKIIEIPLTSIPIQLPKLVFKYNVMNKMIDFIYSIADYPQIMKLLKKLIFQSQKITNILINQNNPNDDDETKENDSNDGIYMLQKDEIMEFIENIVKYFNNPEIGQIDFKSEILEIISNFRDGIPPTVLNSIISSLTQLSSSLIKMDISDKINSFNVVYWNSLDFIENKISNMTNLELIFLIRMGLEKSLVSIREADPETITDKIKTLFKNQNDSQKEFKKHLRTGLFPMLPNNQEHEEEQ